MNNKKDDCLKIIGFDASISYFVQFNTNYFLRGLLLKCNIFIPNHVLDGGCDVFFSLHFSGKMSKTFTLLSKIYFNRNVNDEKKRKKAEKDC